MSLFNRLLVTTLPLVPKSIVGRVAARYVAGETLDDAVRTVRALNAAGRHGDARRARRGGRPSARRRAAAVEEYMRVFDAIAASGSTPTSRSS